MLEVLTGRYPDVQRRRRIIKPSDAISLGRHLIERRDLTESAFNHSLGMIKNKYFERELDKLVHEICDDDSAAKIMQQGIVAAQKKMSGMRFGGIDRPYKPTIMLLKLNYYEPDEPLESHADGVMPNDAAAIALFGNAKFMATAHGTTHVEQPTPEMIIKSWNVEPGDAMFVRNHSTSFERVHQHPNHALQNGPEPRLSLLLEQFYDSANNYF